MTSKMNRQSAFRFPLSLTLSSYNSVKSPSMYFTNFGWQNQRKKRSARRGGNERSFFNLVLIAFTYPLPKPVTTSPSYSDLRLFTGLAIAALIILKLTVNKVMAIAPPMVTTTTHAETSVRYSYFCSHWVKQ